MVLTLTVFLLCNHFPALAAEPDLAPPSDIISGKSQKEWSVLWWQWAGSFDHEDSPVADLNGEKCSARQAGEVWFLAGTYGTKRTIRTCTVPAGKYLFFPLINYIVMPRRANLSSCAEVRRDAAAITNHVSALVLDINGKRFEALELYRQASDQCFDLGAKSKPPQRIFPSAANGYYVMLRPLERGTHVINFGGALPSMLQAVTYTIRVE
jgi:hypothetical protein